MNIKPVVVLVAFLVLGLAGCAPSGLLPAELGGSSPTLAPTAAASPLPPTQAPTAGTTPSLPAQSTAATTNTRNATYEIEGKRVTLVNGLSEIEAAPGSLSKIITRYFGNEGAGDLNGDGQEDAALIVTQEGGGSGTFFYAVAGLQSGGGTLGTNAVLLGDRIAPQNTSVHDGLIEVNYADRNPGEPMTAMPSVGVTRYLKVVDGKLLEVNIPAQITNREWKWVKTQMNDGTLTTPEKPGAFTITFKEDGSLTGTTDCNSYFGKYRIDLNKLSFDPLGQTMMACEGSQEQVFLQALAQVDGFRINHPEGSLVLLLKQDSGSMIFQ